MSGLLFLTTLFCSLFSCQYYNAPPSDPLYSQRISGRGAGGDRRSYARKLSWDPNEAIIQDPIISTKYGQVNGYVMKTIRKRSIYAFEGIPYGEDTSGKNRFKAPIPKSPWKGILSAKRTRSECLQMNPLRSMITINQIYGSENCLFLNIYTPRLPSRRRNVSLPIIFWIHGGAFYLGAGSEYGPAYLLEQNVILVTINYRLGIFGFLSTGDAAIPGNLGLKDQALALKWVHENIDYFGGDHSRVTIAGQSAGGMSAHLHMISHSTRKYYNNVISMSGSAFMPISIMTPRQSEDNNRKLAKLTGCPYGYGKSQRFANCLRRINGNMLVARTVSLFDWGYLPYIPLAPIIEPKSATAFLSVDPHTAYRTGDVNNVTWICTRTKDEGKIVSTALIAFDQNFLSTKFVLNHASILIGYKYTVDNPNLVTKKICEYYLNNCTYYSVNVTALSAAVTDGMFGYGLTKSIQAHSKFAKTYAGLYTFTGKNSWAGRFGLRREQYEISHNDDLDSLFNRSHEVRGYSTTDREYAGIKLITSLFSNFASIGEPLYTTDNDELVKIWEPIRNSSDIQLLQISQNVKMIQEPTKQRLKFWESLLDRHSIVKIS